MKSALICLTFCLVCASAPAAEKVAVINIHGASGGLRLADGCNRDQRQLLHYPCRKRGGNGASHDNWCSASGDARWYPQWPGTKARRDDETEARELFGELYRDNRRQAPSQCRLGEIRRARKCIDHRGESVRIKSDRFNRRGYA